MLFMLAGLSACWLDLHTRWTLCMLAGLCACWLDFVHAGWTLCMLAGLSSCSQDLLHAGRTNCTLAGLRAYWLDFLHAAGSRTKYQVSLYLCESVIFGRITFITLCGTVLLRHDVEDRDRVCVFSLCFFFSIALFVLILSICHI
jgi:hypothetical protein